jgi:hypothetical protein
MRIGFGEMRIDTDGLGAICDVSIVLSYFPQIQSGLSPSFFSPRSTGAFDQRSAFLRAAAWLIGPARRPAPSWPDTRLDPVFSTPHSSRLSDLLSMSRIRD